MLFKNIYRNTIKPVFLQIQILFYANLVEKHKRNLNIAIYTTIFHKIYDSCHISLRKSFVYSDLIMKVSLMLAIAM